MPNISVKRVYIEKLIELGLYDKWLNNIKQQWDDTDNCYLNPKSYKYNSYVKVCVVNISFKAFINYSFAWYKTPEGHHFWYRYCI